MGTTIRTTISKSNPYYICKHEYLMTKHFVLLYPEWKKRKNEIESQLNCAFKIASGHNDSIVSPVELAQEKSEKYSIRIEIIEQAAKIAGGDIWKYVLYGVTTQCSYEHLRLVKNIPCCKEVYYKMYRQFYWIVNNKLWQLFDR